MSAKLRRYGVGQGPDYECTLLPFDNGRAYLASDVDAWAAEIRAAVAHLKESSVDSICDCDVCVAYNMALAKLDELLAPDA